jgi:hypothetical protein
MRSATRQGDTAHSEVRDPSRVVSGELHMNAHSSSATALGNTATTSAELILLSNLSNAGATDSSAPPVRATGQLLRRYCGRLEYWREMTAFRGMRPRASP